MTIPELQYNEAQTELDGIGNAVTNGAQAAPDLVMRLVIVARDLLTRHRPEQVDEHHYLHGTCVADGQWWPCADAAEVLRALSVRSADEYLD
jgi:hypothetical protein